MRPSWILFLAACLATGCASPSEHSASSAPGDILDYADPPSVLTGLGGRLAITAEAPSWAALVEKLHPTMTVYDYDLISVGHDEHGQLQFALDEAYPYQPPGQPLRWVLLDEPPNEAPFDEFYGEVMGRNLHGSAKLVPKVPDPVSDSEIYGDYAIVKASNPACGTVYEIGWQKLMANGTCLCEENRKLYVLQDAQGQWHFLGEGEPVGHGKSGANQGGSDDVESSVVWTNAQPPNLPVEIHFTVTDTRDEWDSEGVSDTFKPRPNLVRCDDYVIAAPFPANPRRTISHPYVLAQPGDTLDKIAQVNAVWESDMMKDSEKAFYEKTWREGLARLNPDLPPTAILTPGTKVQLLNQTERDAAASDYDAHFKSVPAQATSLL